MNYGYKFDGVWQATDDIPNSWQPTAKPGDVKVRDVNGDGVAEAQSLSFKLVRPSTVTASLIGPDRVPRQVETGPKEAGTYRLSWSGRTQGGQPEPEGRWRFVINAVDDQARESSSERTFFLNNTLGYLRVSPSRVVVRRRGGSLRVGFRLTRPARVTLTIETSAM